ncbi:MAG: mannose-1-phosphate guanylyltransferase/mannose-6-phosphate isomerase [Burkholderiales bacterium]
MAERIIPVILCGGSGSRLWPMSRRLLPKQFLPLAGPRTLFQDTVLRTRRLADGSKPIVVANVEHRFLAAEQLQELGAKPLALLLEPVGRNTAPAIAVAALQAAHEPDAILVVQPSDHVIGDAASFEAALQAALGPARDGFLVTFGIPPTGPATGYGYIEIGQPLAASAAFRIQRFVEKPKLEQATKLVADGKHLWNSGMFVFRGQRFLEELGRLQPEMLARAREALERGARDLDFVRLDEEAFAACPAKSIDYAVMEHTRHGAVIRADMAWTDVGSWSALWEIGTKDAAGNVTQGEVALRDAKNCYVYAGDRHVSLLGTEDVVVVETDDAVLVAARSRAEEVKDVVEQLARTQSTQHVSHSRVHRPWGSFQSIDAGPGFQVKRLIVKPGHKISLQLHRKRAEHWVVVSGVARVTRGERVFDLNVNESTYIPVGTKHRLENLGPAPLIIIEVQSGPYLGEDDIERFEDSYNRDSSSR